MTTCSVDGCERPFYGRLVCKLHYERLRRTGATGPADPRQPRDTCAERCPDGAYRIPLTRGQWAIVDADDVVWLSQWAWTATPRAGGKWDAIRGVSSDGAQTTSRMAREILGLAPGDPREADHINHDTLDNRRSNLRILTATKNKRWVPSRGGSSRFVGVTWDSDRQNWRAQIQVDGVVRNLGRHATEEAAARARDAFVLEYQTGHELNLPRS